MDESFVFEKLDARRHKGCYQYLVSSCNQRCWVSISNGESRLKHLPEVFLVRLFQTTKGTWERKGYSKLRKKYSTLNGEAQRVEVYQRVLIEAKCLVNSQHVIQMVFQNVSYKGVRSCYDIQRRHFVETL